VVVPGQDPHTTHVFARSGRAAEGDVVARPAGRPPPGFDWPAHRTLLAGGVLIVEHLANLDRVAGERFELWALPIPIVGADGAPARVVARGDTR
jgi:kynurenine formamidase